VYDLTDEFAELVPPKFVKLVADATAALEIEELVVTQGPAGARPAAPE
jgi:hypothetical protein